MKCLLYDTDHAHQESLTLGRKPRYIEWTREEFDTDKAFYTNRQVFKDIDNNKINYALVIEPRCMISDVYDYIEAKPDKFDFILTHDSELLQLSNSYWIPGNGTWYQGPLDKKIKNISMLCSNKCMTHSHKWRRSIGLLLEKAGLIDLMGGIKGKHIHLNNAFQQYRFNVAIENHWDKRYFTEKLLNCFASMTIPIYLGASREFLLTKFDINGIIFLEEANGDYVNFVKSIKPEIYEQKIGSIVSNYNIVQDYLSLDDYIYENYINRIGD